MQLPKAYDSVEAYTTALSAFLTSELVTLLTVRSAMPVASVLRLRLNSPLSANPLGPDPSPGRPTEARQARAWQ